MSCRVQSITRSTRSSSRAALLITWALVATSCATVGGPSTGDRPSGEAPSAGPPATAGWVIRTREHVDLWLHGYALLQRDTARVPFFRRGYRDRMLAERRQRGVTTALDLNMERLTSRLVSNPSLVNGQFLPLYFDSFSDMRSAVDLFVRVEGQPRAAGSEAAAYYVALLAAAFPTAGDREWVRIFTQSLAEEHQRFYSDYWASEQRARAATLAAVETQWSSTHGPRFERFLMNTQQTRGEIILSLPLDGEGRTLSAGPGRAGTIAVQFPDDPASAEEAIYVFAHEAIIPVVNTAISDNVTPAEQRSGVADRYASNAAVRGGAMLLDRVAPTLVDGYMRYYLRAANLQPSAGASLRNAFAAAFPLPDLILDAANRQLEIVLGGI